MPDRVIFAVVAATTESFISRDCLTPSTYSFVTREFVPNLERFLYPEGTTTVPVPFVVKRLSPFELVL